MIIKGNSVGHPLPDPRKGLEMHGGINMNGQRLRGLNAPVADDEAANKGYADKGITDRVIYGKGKNLLKNTAKSQTINGVTFTVNDDGSVTANGTASNASSAYIAIPITLTIGEKYIVSGCPVGGSAGSYQVYVTDTTFNSDFPDFGQGKTFTAKYEECIVRVLISKGYTANNLTFYPMIRLASETDDTYEPYYEGRKELTDKGMEYAWENTSFAANTAFEGQTISLSAKLRDYYGFFCVAADRYAFMVNSGFVTHHHYMGLLQSSKESANLRRDITLDYANNTITFSNVYVDGTENTDWNNYLIPYALYGIKLGG